MAKIYNEVVIDMNPESPTFEETLYEDSYEGEFGMLCDAPPLGPGEAADAYFNDSKQYTAGYGNKVKYGDKYYYYTADRGWYLADSSASNFEADYYTDVTDDMADWTLGSTDFTTPVGERGDVGIPQVTEENWMAMTLDEQAQYILDIRYQGNVPDEENDLQYLRGLLANQPIKGDIDPTKAGFYEEEYGRTGADAQYAQYDYNNDGELSVLDVHQAPGDLQQTIIDLIMSGNTDIGTSFADSLAGQAAGLAYGTAGRTYETAGLSWEGAEQTFGESLGALQRTAEGQATATGGSTSIGMRGKIGQQKLLKEGFGSAVSTRGRAEDAYDISTRAYGAAGDAYGLAEQTADLDYRQKMYGLEEDVIGDWESSWGTFWDSLPPATGN